MKKLLATLATGALFSGAAFANTYTLTFDQANACGGAPCANYDLISQAYGDQAGVVDITYIDVLSSTTALKSLNWWNDSYNDLHGVAWASGGDSSSHGRIEIRALGGGNVTLDSMDFGAWVTTTRGTHIRVTDIGGATTLFSYDGNVGSGSSHTSFAPGASSANGLWIDWYNSAYNVGIDNVRFTVAVPEPETYALFLAGLGVLGTLSRRRKLLPA